MPDPSFYLIGEHVSTQTSLERYKKKYVSVKGLKMAYVDEGKGNPILFLHGNPSSSYEWRNVIPHLVDMGRCIAPDLIGMGDSEKLPDSGPSSYRFVQHREYLDALLKSIDVRENVTLVLHDWGSALGFDWAYRHPHAVKRIVYMEAFVAPISSWKEWPTGAVEFFKTLRSASGEELVLDKNIFIEKILPACMLRELSECEMNIYRRPYVEPGESRRPTLTWPREIPISGEPRDVCEIIQTYNTWLGSATIPKLFIEAIPGEMFKSHREIALAWPNQKHIQIKGGHFVQEDSPDEVGQAIVLWLKSLITPVWDQGNLKTNHQ
jgi:haloalkane dehalogenase